MWRAVVLALVLVSGPALAQDRGQTLADIRQELTVLYVEVQKLKRELSTTGAPQVNLSGTSALDRLNTMEAELSRLTAATEALTNRVNRVVQDGTNRISDLEFRLVELEGGDISKLGETTTLGGDEGLPAPAVAAPAPGQGGMQMAVGEQRDFDAALAAYEAGSYEAASIQFATFVETYPGGPLTAEAHYWRGMALSSIGNTSGAARAFLESFSGAPDGRMAPLALLALGLALDALGQTDEACVMLGEVTGRFPDSASSIEAQTARVDMGCA